MVRSLGYRFYVALRGLRYGKHLRQLEGYKRGYYEILAKYRGIEINDLPLCAKKWGEYVSTTRVDYTNVQQPFCNWGLAANISDQLSRVDLYANLERYLGVIGAKRRIRFMDYGCGSAAVSLSLADYCETLYLTDVNKGVLDYLEYVVRSRRLTNVRVFHPERVEALVDDESLDICLCIDVLEHLEKPSEVFNLIHRKVAVGGSLLMRAPWGDTFWGKHPDHNLSARTEFCSKKCDVILRRQYDRTASFTFLDMWYRQGLFKKLA